MKKMISIIIALLLVAMSAMALAEAAAPTNAGILRISVSASDLATTKAFFDDVMEMDCVAEGELDKETVKTLYNMDATAKYAMYNNGLQNTLVQVLEFDPRPTKTAREGFNAWDGGYFDIAYRCQDNDEAYAKFSAMGYEFPTPPYRYVTSWSNSEVLEAVMFGPDIILCQTVTPGLLSTEPHSQRKARTNDDTIPIDTVSDSKGHRRGIDLPIPKQAGKADRHITSCIHNLVPPD